MTIVFTFPNASHIKHPLKQGQFEHNTFPDGESYMRILSKVQGHNIIILNNLNNPDDKLMPLFLLCETAKKMGAKKITLLAPYLPYMRQDSIFQEGEALSAKIFARLLGTYVDKLVTVDPHLHRFKSLSEIYSIETKVFHAHKMIQKWIMKNIHSPLLIGPDEESAPLIKSIAESIKAPFIIAKKTRCDATHVKIHLPYVSSFKSHTPVIVDDVISTGHTIEALSKKIGRDSHCIAVHALFAADANKRLKKYDIVTCNTIKHPTNKIDLTPLFEDAF